VAGYSGTPLARKLGVKEGATVALVGAPKGWRIPQLPAGAGAKDSLRGAYDVAVVFVRAMSDLRRRVPALVRSLRDDAAVWIAWPRKAGGHLSDVTENAVRDLVLPTGLVDVKVAALDEDWSGLKFVRRRELRGRA
jgi:hypothetical protein